MNEVEYPKPQNVGRISNTEILFGKPIAPIDRLKVMSPSDFEDFIREWVEGYLVGEHKYCRCTKSSGAGDQGRDVIAYIDTNTAKWDNYQCKHYNHALMPSDVYIEIGKLLYYTFKGEYTCPENYFFVAPLGIGPELNRLLENPEDLKIKILENWDLHCKNKIQSKQEIPLDDDFKSYIEKFNFKILKGYDPQTIIEQHATTIYFPFRFGGGIKRIREKPSSAPTDIKKHELTYTSQILKSYGEYLGKEVNSYEDLVGTEELCEHFNRQRNGFYSADSLNQFSRDTFPTTVNYFDELKDEIYTGVIDVCNSTYPHGYDRIKATTQCAKILSLPQGMNPLVQYLSQGDREGLCNHLVNEDRLKWVNNG